jgi:hypothetical protein
MTDEERTTEHAAAPVRDVIAQPAKLLRIGTMTRLLLEEARHAPLDPEGRERMREIHERSLRELGEALSPDLREELAELALPFGEGTPTESELRISQAQLVGWLEGLFHGIQAALWTQHAQAQAQAQQFPSRLPPGPDQQAEPGRYL